MAKITRAQKWYVAGAAYRLNRQLISTGVFEPEDADDARLYRQFLQEFNSTQPLTQPMRAYRGIGQGTNTMGRGGFASASLDERVAESFVEVRLVKSPYSWEYGRMTEIRTGEYLVLDIQPGVRVMNIDGAQNEVVIEPDIEIEITNTIRSNGSKDQSTTIWMTIRKSKL